MRHTHKRHVGGYQYLPDRENCQKIKEGKERKNNSVYLQEIFFFLSRTQNSSFNLADFLEFIYLFIYLPLYNLIAVADWDKLKLTKATFLLQAYIFLSFQIYLQHEALF